MIPAQPKIDDVLAAFIKIRDKQAEMKERHKTELAPLEQSREKLETYLLAFLNTTGSDSIVAKGTGTAFKQEVTTVTVRDWPATIAWIKQNDAWEFLEKRVSKSVVQEYSEANNALPPGLEMQIAIEVRVRRA